MGVRTGTAAVATAVILPGVLLLTVILLAVELGTKLRAIGRGFGRGTLGLAAQAFVASADKPTASVRVVAKAVDRNAAARTRRFTAFLSLRIIQSLKLQVYLIESAGKILIPPAGLGLCATTAAKSRLDQ